MVGDRGPQSQQASRFLTTSMLPRIHTLRDAGRIVFIIATNYRERLDPAAVRPGRVDRIFRVDRPDPEERKTILDKLAGQFSAPTAIRSFVQSKSCIDATDKFTVGYLKDLIRTLVVEQDKCENDSDMLQIVKSIGERVIKEVARDSTDPKAGTEPGL